ncbi:MAG: hypothetical protein FWE04_01230 [Oscillospiraceae bacterium]|nr:hypothetical protein [Oscillospiraceae bacterium]
MSIVGITRKIESCAAKSKLAFWFAKLYYHAVIRKEIQLAKIRAGDNMLCIGGGVCPFSAIMFHQTTGARVTVVDNCETCARLARSVVEQLGLSEKIRVQCRDGADMDVSEYSVVHLAKQISPAETVLSEVKNRASAMTRLLIREPKKRIGNTLLYVKGGAA